MFGRTHLHDRYTHSFIFLSLSRNIKTGTDLRSLAVCDDDTYLVSIGFSSRTDLVGVLHHIFLLLHGVAADTDELEDSQEEPDLVTDLVDVQALFEKWNARIKDGTNIIRNVIKEIYRGRTPPTWTFFTMPGITQKVYADMCADVRYIPLFPSFVSLNL